MENFAAKERDSLPTSWWRQMKEDSMHQMLMLPCLKKELLAYTKETYDEI